MQPDLFEQTFMGQSVVQLLLDPARLLVVRANPAACSFYGYPPGAMDGKPLTKLTASSVTELGRLFDHLSSLDGKPVLSKHISSSGMRKDVELFLSPVNINGSELIHCIIYDISVYLRQAAFFEAITDSALEAIALIDEQGLIRIWNPAAEDLFGYTAQEALGQKLMSILMPRGKFSPSYRARMRRALKRHSYSMEIDLHHRKGHWLPLEISISRFKHNDQNFVTVNMKDITERRISEENLRQLANHDSLTDLYNRRHFIELLEREFQRRQRTQKPLTLMMLDLDYFKRVNDTYGHHVGDQVLRMAAMCIQDSVRVVDVVGRLGGEEFAVFMPYTDLEGAIIPARRILQKMASSWVSVGKLQVGCTVSIGLALATKSADNPEKLLSIADKALYAAKEAGRNQVQLAVQEMKNLEPVDPVHEA